MSERSLSVGQLSTLVSALMVISTSLFAYVPNQTLTAKAETPTQESIEIITITGLRSLGFFRKQYRQAEDDFFDAINALALDQSFEIECESKPNSFSRIKKRVCEPKYVDDIKYELTQLAIGGRPELNKTFLNGGVATRMYKLSTRGELRNMVAAKRKKHIAALEKAIRDNPEVQVKLLNLNKAKYSLEQKKVEVFGEAYASAASEVVSDTQQFVENTH